jgi:hypothetical protein
MNRRGFLAGFLAARSGQGFLDTCLRRPPGWPLLEALAIAAAVLMVVTLAVELGAAVAACLPF